MSISVPVRKMPNIMREDLAGKIPSRRKFCRIFRAKQKYPLLRCTTTVVRLNIHNMF